MVVHCSDIRNQVYNLDGMHLASGLTPVQL